jgi:hypothetical protein
VDAGVTWQVIQASFVNSGQFDWVVPTTSTTQGRIRVRDSASSAIQDILDGPFSISQPTSNVLFVDDFNRTGALGTNWTLSRGSFTANGSAAVSSATQSSQSLRAVGNRNRECTRFGP